MRTILFSLALVSGCAYPTSQVGDGDDCTDCDDTDAEVTCYDDLDEDGHGNVNYFRTLPGTECPEGYAAVGDDWCDSDPSAWQYDDCNLVITWYRDLDGDGYGDAALSVVQSTQPVGYVDNAEDCDDTDESVNPGATEVHNGVDDDCDGTIDEGCSDEPIDTDDDGYNSEASGGTDCDDTDADIHPGADEKCNGVDDDCDGAIDEGCGDGETHTVCVVDAGDNVNEWDLGILLDGDETRWVSESSGTARVVSPLLTESDSDDCATFVGSRAKFNGYSPDSGMWRFYIVGADNGDDATVMSSSGLASVLKLEVDGHAIGFCSSTYDLCWNW